MKPMKADKLTSALHKGYQQQGPKQWPMFQGVGNLDRSSVVTASEVGSCERMLWYEKNLPTEVSAVRAAKLPDLTGAWAGHAERGHTAEAWAVRHILKGGVNMICCGDDQVSFVKDHMSGTPDGIIISNAGTSLDVIDIKSIDPRLKKSNLPKPAHIAQVTANCWLVSSLMDKPVAYGRLLYINANDYADMTEFQFGYSPKEGEKHAEKAKSVMTAQSAEDLTPEGMYNGGCRFCQHTEQCSAAVEYAQEQKKQARQQSAVSKAFFK